MRAVQVILLTGGSSGIGRETALALSRAGHKVYEVSRRDAAQAGVVHLCADVTSDADVARAVQQVLDAEGRIDLLINNAGYGISGAVEFTDATDARQQFDVNFFGMERFCRAVLPAMRARGQGRIINVSSVAAAIPIPFQAYYSATKAAINAFTLALGNEVRPYGVEVCAVMPGDIRTGFTEARRREEAGNAAYGGRLARSVAKMERDEQQGMPPAAVADFLVRLAHQRSVKPLYAIRWDYRLFVLLSRCLPVRWLNRIVFELYAK